MPSAPMHETPTPGSARPVRLTFLTVTGEKLSVDTKPTDTLPVVRRRIELAPAQHRGQHAEADAR